MNGTPGLRRRQRAAQMLRNHGRVACLYFWFSHSICETRVSGNREQRMRSKPKIAMENVTHLVELRAQEAELDDVVALGAVLHRV